MKKTSGKSLAVEMESIFQAFADRTRLRLLNLMSDGEVCVCFFVEALDEPQPKISRHLAYLRNAGLVSARRDAKWVHYRLTPPEQPAVRQIFESVLETFRNDPEMQRDHANLARACCSPRAPELLRRAPRPQFVDPQRA